MKFKISHWRGGSLKPIQDAYSEAVLTTLAKHADFLEVEIAQDDFIEFCSEFGPVHVVPPGYAPLKGEWFLWVTK